MSRANRDWRPSQFLTCCIVATLASSALPAFAQDGDVDTVVVTGSRIRQDPLNQPAPLVTVDDEDIARSGLTSIGDLLQRMPVSGGGLNTKFNTSGNIGFPPDGGGVGAGAATADLRHLGAKRTLVLVDGIRWVNESSASGVGAATDLNTIPTSIIPMIEPNPNTTIYVSPSDTDRADDSTINNNAADPARPWAMPIQNGRTESRHQCTCP